MRKTILIMFSLSLVPAALASELLVPSQYQTIQYAINAAANGDTIIVEPGQSYGRINFYGKAITVRSSDPSNWATVQNAIIDGGGTGSCVVFNTGEGSNSILEGFTLTNGSGTNVDYSYYNGRTTGQAGGGILCLNSSPTIRRCNITANGLFSSGGGGGGGGGPRRDGNISLLAYTDLHGGGIALIGDCRATIESCFVTDNTAHYGAGILIRSYTPQQAASQISNCTVANNFRELQVPTYQIDCWDTRVVISNSIIWGGDCDGLFIEDPSLVTYCCLEAAYIFEGDYNQFADPCDLAGTAGNISQDPRFVEPAADSELADYHLLSNSPCVDAGDPDVSGGGLDIDGQSRVMAGRVDIGADEVVAEIIVTKPSGQTVWTSGSAHEIAWSGPSGIAVDILLSTNGGADWQTMADNVPGTGSKTCTLPDSVDSNNCLVSVVPTIPDATIICTQSGTFTIRPYLPGPAAESKWKSLGGDFARTGLSDSNGPEFGCIKWKFEAPAAVSASVTIGPDETVYVPCEGGKLSALDSNGSELWSYDANSPLISSPTIGPDGTAYVGGQNGRLYAVDSNGNLRWTHSTDGFIYSSPAVSEDGKIYVCSQDGRLYALGRDGSELWSFETKGPGAVPTGSIFASPTIGPDGAVYIAGLYDPNLYALDANDGSVKWACNFEHPINPDYPEGPTESGWPFTSPVIAPDGTIYQTLLYDPNLYAIDSNDGSIIWSTNLRIHCEFVDSQLHVQYPLPPMEQIRDNCTYWIQLASALDTRSAYLHYRDASCWSEPALGPDGTIYVSFDDPYLRAVDPNGSIKWVTDLGIVGGFNLTVGKNGLIYAAGDDGALYVVDADGWEVARFSSDAWLNYPVVATDGVIIVGDGRDDSLLITDPSNIVRAIRLDGCAGRTFDLALIQDLDADGNVDLVDLALIAANWLDCTDTDWPCGYEGAEIYLTGDIDRNKYVHFSDLGLMAERWLGSDGAPKGPKPPKRLGPPDGWPEPPQPPGPPPSRR